MLWAGTIARPSTAAGHAHGTNDQNHPSDGASALSVSGLLADALAALAIERPPTHAEVRDVAAPFAARAGVPVAELCAAAFGRATRDPRVLALPPALAAEVELRLLVALTPARDASLWLADGRRTRCVDFVGCEPTRRMRAAAREALTGIAAAGARSAIRAVAVRRFDQPAAALVVRSGPDFRERMVQLAEECAGALGLVLERESLLERSMARERALVEAGERRLVRLGFDLHDGPIQGVTALVGDLRHFRGQLSRLVPDRERSLALGRVDDLHARLVELDRELRDVVHALGSPALLGRPLDEVLRREVDSFAAGTDVEVELDLRGDLSDLTPSQRIALMRVVQEALSNVREHSGANAVSVSVWQETGKVTARIVDNGGGFEVEETLVRAARGGRVGLAGMSERVRLLGGVFDVQSTPGRGTTVSLALPEWRPLEVEHPAAAESS
jgi:signal transduction histidine kinase